MNAMEGTDLLVGGFMNGIVALRERNIQRAEAQLENSLLSQLNEWKIYAGKLEARVEALRKLAITQQSQLTAQQESYQKEKNSLQSLAEFRRGMMNLREKHLTNAKERLKSSVERNNQLRDELALALAENFAISSLKDRLVAKLSEFCDPESCDLLDAQKQAEIHHADRDEFAKKASAEKLPTTQGAGKG